MKKVLLENIAIRGLTRGLVHGGTKTPERETHIHRGTSGLFQRFIVQSTDRALKISFLHRFSDILFKNSFCQ